MGTTRKRIAYLIGFLFASNFILIASGRIISGIAPDLLVKPERPSVEALAQFSNFNAIRAHGDFKLEIVQGDNYFIDYITWSDLSGNITISQEEGTLFIGGQGNTVLGRQQTTIRVITPTIQSVHAQSLPVLTISGFDEPELIMDLRYVYRLNLSDARIGSLEIDSSVGDELYFTNLETQNRLIKTWGARHSKARIIDQ